MITKTVLKKLQVFQFDLPKRKLSDLKNSTFIYSAKNVNQSLRSNPEETYMKIFGAETFKHKDEYEMRWKGGIKVELTGKFRGKYSKSFFFF